MAGKRAVGQLLPVQIGQVRTDRERIHARERRPRGVLVGEFPLPERSEPVEIAAVGAHGRPGEAALVGEVPDEPADRPIQRDHCEECNCRRV